MSQQQDPNSYDYDDPRRYTSQRAQGKHARGGGAVISKRSGVGAALKGRRHDRQKASAGRAAAAPRRQQAATYDYDAQGGYGYGYDGGYSNAASKPARKHHHVRARTVVLSIIAILVAIYLVVFLPIDRSIAFSDEEAAGLSSELTPHIPCTPYYVLALGSDAREGDTVSRTDTMILCRIDPIQAKITMVSIPRDTKVEIEGQGTQKINAAYAFGGAAGATKAVSDLCGVGISHVAVIHFDGIEALVNALGGVTVTVPVDINDPSYTGLVMPAGTYEMDGHTAMLFSRVRHGFANGDYQRQEDQRILISAIMDKALKNPLSLPKVGSAMDGLISTTMRCYSIIPLMMRMAIGKPTIYSASLPSTTEMDGGVSYVVADKDATQRLMQVVNSGGDPQTVANGLS